MSRKSAKPFVVEIDDPKKVETPAEAPAVPELAEAPPTGQTMQTLATLAARPPSRLARLFWGSLLALITFFASVAAWDFVTAMIARNEVLGWIAIGLSAVFVLTLLIIILREWLALGRLRRIDRFRDEAAIALRDQNTRKAAEVASGLSKLYANRPELGGARQELSNNLQGLVDVEAMLASSERHLLTPLDAAALREVEAAARQVATVTAIVPIALADLLAALTCNLRMIRRVAEIYGGRGGTIGSWRLTRTVLAHLVATGAVAVGDDLLGSLAGGGILAKVSRRFGEGLINGALTARVGVAAIEVCRPLEFRTEEKPSVTGIVGRALTGLFPTGK